MIFMTACLLALHQIPSGKELTLKGKNVFLMGKIISFQSQTESAREANYFIYHAQPYPLL